MRPPTIRDVAQRAGVGLGTVSRVINGSSQVRETTRKRVLLAIEELGFNPNLAARQLSGGKTHTIGVVTPYFTYPSFTERLAGIQSVLDESGYDLVLYSIRSPEQLQYRLFNLVAQNRADGLIVLCLPVYEREIIAANPELPVMIIDFDSPETYPSITIDDVEGGYLATHYLIEHGHQKIGFIGDEIENTFGFVSTRRRYEGYQRALQEAGLPHHKEWCLFDKHGQEFAHQNARQMLSLADRPTAIFGANDTLAFGVLAAAEELGLRVPEDVAVIGFDDIEAARYMRLTTVHQPLYLSGELGAQRLLQWMRQGRYEDRHLQLPLKIVSRATV